MGPATASPGMAVTPERLQGLMDLGLAEYPARAYLALLDLGAAQAKDVARLARVPKGKVYGALDALHGKGLAEVSPERPKRYRPLPLRAFLHRRMTGLSSELATLAAREEELMSEYRARAVPLEPEARAATPRALRGRRNVLDRETALLGAARRDVLWVLAPGGAPRLLHHAPRLRALAAAGARVRVLHAPGAPGRDAAAALGGLTELRPAPLPATAPVDAILVDGRSLLLVHRAPDDAHLYTGRDSALEVDDAALVAHLGALLQDAWTRATPSGPVDALATAVAVDVAWEAAARGGGPLDATLPEGHPALLRALAAAAEAGEPLRALVADGATERTLRAAGARVRRATAPAGDALLVTPTVAVLAHPTDDGGLAGCAHRAPAAVHAARQRFADAWAAAAHPAPADLPRPIRRDLRHAPSSPAAFLRALAGVATAAAATTDAGATRAWGRAAGRVLATALPPKTGAREAAAARLFREAGLGDVTFRAGRAHADAPAGPSAAAAAWAGLLDGLVETALPPPPEPRPTQTGNATAK